MKCPICNGNSKVIDTRFTCGARKRRRRECLECGARFVTMEIMIQNEDNKEEQI